MIVVLMDVIVELFSVRSQKQALLYISMILLMKRSLLSQYG